MVTEESVNGGNGDGTAEVLRQLADHPEIGEISRVLTELRTLSETSMLLDRLRFATQHGVTFNGKRKEYEIFGYDDFITYRQYREEYARGGIAGRVVDVMPDACWRGEVPFEIIEDEDPEIDTEFEKAWKAISLKHKVPTKLQRADRLSRLSTYSVILIGAPGALNTELPRAKNADSLLYFKPYSGGGGPGSNSDRRTVDSGARATIYEYDEDPSSPRFGEPLTYTINFFQRRLVAGESPLPRVHWSRIIHVAEGLLEDDVFGQPVLERVWNLLIDLRKVTGGGSEAFYLRANQGLHFNIDKDMALTTVTTPAGAITTAEVEALKEQAEAYKHQLTRWLRTRGVEVNTLGSDVANFSAPADAIITQIAGARATPKRILTGSEMGELASSQDRENWKDQVDGRQTQHCGPNLVRQVVDRFVTYGYLPTPKKGPLEYQVKWPHIQVMTEAEKSDGAVKWSQTKVGEDPVFTDAEIRDKWYAMAPLSDEQRAQIDERKAEAVQRQQNAMAAAKPPEEKDDERGLLRAAEEEDEELIEILARAIKADAGDVVAQIVGLSRFPRELEWNESQHPRDKSGKFTDGGGGGGGSTSESGANFDEDISTKYPIINEMRAYDERDARSVKSKLRQQGRLNKDGTVSLYHSTLSDPNSILKHGLVPAFEAAPAQDWQATHSKQATYFFLDREHAVDQIEQGGAGSVIEARIPITGETLSRFLPDEDSSPNIYDGVKVLVEGGAVAFIGGVPPSAVRVVHHRE